MFLFSAGKILFIAWGYHQASRLYSEAEEAYVAPEQDDTGFSADELRGSVQPGDSVYFDGVTAEIGGKFTLADRKEG